MIPRRSPLSPDRVPIIHYDEDDYLNADPYPDAENNDSYSRAVTMIGSSYLFHTFFIL
jgi:hypothetical protein